MAAWRACMNTRASAVRSSGGARSAAAQRAKASLQRRPAHQVRARAGHARGRRPDVALPRGAAAGLTNSSNGT